MTDVTDEMVNVRQELLQVCDIAEGWLVFYIGDGSAKDPYYWEPVIALARTHTVILDDQGQELSSHVAVEPLIGDYSMLYSITLPGQTESFDTTARVPSLGDGYTLLHWSKVREWRPGRHMMDSQGLDDYLASFRRAR